MHQTIIQIIVAYTLAGVFVFTAVVTALSLLGIVKFADKRQQRRLFQILICELVIGCVAFFIGWLKFDPRKASTQIAKEELSSRRKAFEEKLRQARMEFTNTNFSKSYELANELYLGSDLRDFFPIRDLFVLSGDIAKERGFWIEATETYGSALKLDPLNASLLGNAGFSYRQLQNYTVALKLYQRALVIEGQSWMALHGYSQCLRRYAMYLAGIQQREASDKLFEEEADVVERMQRVANSEYQRRKTDLTRAALFWGWKRYDVAEQAYKAYVTKYPDDQRFRQDLGELLIERGSFREAFDELSSLYKSGKTPEAELWFVESRLAEAAAKAAVPKEELEWALKAGLHAVLQKPNRPEEWSAVYTAVARVYRALGNVSKADEYIDLAIVQEARRDSDPYTYDPVRHNEALNLKKEWTTKSAAK
jgi:tetratricopeptide (TPR) repeat protein